MKRKESNRSLRAYRFLIQISGKPDFQWVPFLISGSKSRIHAIFFDVTRIFTIVETLVNMKIMVDKWCKPMKCILSYTMLLEFCEPIVIFVFPLSAGYVALDIDMIRMNKYSNECLTRNFINRALNCFLIDQN